HVRDTDNKLGDIGAVISFIDSAERVVDVSIPELMASRKQTLKQCVIIKKHTIEGVERYVTTILNHIMANGRVSRGLPGEKQIEYNDENEPFTPAWQEKLSGVPAGDVAQVAREFAQNAIDSKGRSMIIMGSGINHWYHSDMIYRTILNLVLLTGCEG